MNAIVSVTLEADEAVRWEWSCGPRGSYVSGYRLVPRWRAREVRRAVRLPRPEA